MQKPAVKAHVTHHPLQTVYPCTFASRCGLQGLTPESFYLHQPLYHIYHANIDGYCPIKVK
eukprot:1148441-Pelagomonas_calceolata.AAC.7